MQQPRAAHLSVVLFVLLKEIHAELGEMNQILELLGGRDHHLTAKVLWESINRINSHDLNPTHLQFSPLPTVSCSYPALHSPSFSLSSLAPPRAAQASLCPSSKHVRVARAWLSKSPQVDRMENNTCEIGH